MRPIKILRMIDAYRARYPDEADAARLRRFIEAQPRCFERDCFDDGHITGSAWVVDPAGSRVLLTHHRKLGKWLQLGGHSDGEPDTLADPDLRREACAAFLDLYSVHGHDRSRVYPGVRGGLAALHARGAALACITNKPHAPAVDLLAHLELLDSFELVLGGDSLPRRKPDPLPLLHACSELGVAVEHSVFIGDSINDVEAARAAGMRVACVSYGYNHGRDISETAPDAIIDSLDELDALCFGAPAAEHPGR